MSGPTPREIERPRSAPDLIGTSFELYLAYPWLFLSLAGVIAIPWEVLQFVSFEFLHGTTRTLVDLFLSISDLALVLPLIAASTSTPWTNCDAARSRPSARPHGVARRPWRVSRAPSSSAFSGSSSG
jgi:hypothetical protein